MNIKTLYATDGFVWITTKELKVNIADRLGVLCVLVHEYALFIFFGGAL